MTTTTLISSNLTDNLIHLSNNFKFYKQSDPIEHQICKLLAHNELKIRHSGLDQVKIYLFDYSRKFNKDSIDDSGNSSGSDSDVEAPHSDPKNLKNSRTPENSQLQNLQNNLQKIWKGLFYMLWHSDGLTHQEKLTKDFSLLIHEIEANETYSAYLLNFINAYFIMMSKEWQGIDRYRISKYMLMMRFIGVRVWGILFNKIGLKFGRSHSSRL